MIPLSPTAMMPIANLAAPMSLGVTPLLLGVVGILGCLVVVAMVLRSEFAVRDHQDEVMPAVSPIGLGPLMHKAA